MNAQMQKSTLLSLFKSTFDQEPEFVKALPPTGSSRKYYRLSTTEKSALGVINQDVKENETYFYFTEKFKNAGIKVPKILEIAADKKHYLVEDFGDETLAKYFKSAEVRTNSVLKINILKTALSDLLELQFKVDNVLDYGKAYPRNAFDAQSIQWDLNYFKYCFLKSLDVPFDEQNLEDEFNVLMNAADTVQPKAFIYRDFNIRNIMKCDEDLGYLDFQGGRKGPVFYDLASLLMSPTSNLDAAHRKILEDYYLARLEEKVESETNINKSDYYLIALLRVAQALGAYGYRGLQQHKAGFANSIAKGIENLAFLVSKNAHLNLSELGKISDCLSRSKWAEEYKLPKNKLTIKIESFSYKRGVPIDPSPNGGGFVFDCRGIPNPGRYAEYKTKSGLDECVINYLENYDEVHYFAEQIQQTIKVSVDNYIQRGFDHICVFFGCTGGQHRSVYNAVRTSKWLTDTYGNKVNILLSHRETNYWNP